ncbi:hypothetical protein AN957_18930 [Cytobacillus solani]|uniref:Replication-relaxation n=1 Tax=Cytobacillus solani TaxID=1637975 RepID=A0A0Q3VID4_9BACI|nr:hypothetical protein AN957_18930 [Cytobacillus solani]
MKQLNERQERILLSLKKLDFLNRDQLMKLHRLGKKRNANRILHDLSYYLSSFREGYQAIYYLNKEGREYVNSQKVRKKNSFVNHVLMRNDFYIFMGFPHEWINEAKVKDSKYSVVCDAWFKKGGLYHILEVDHTQKMKENKVKVAEYKNLYKSGEMAAHFGYFPKLIWITTTELRRKQLTELCKGLPCTVYTISDIR